MSATLGTARRVLVSVAVVVVTASVSAACATLEASARKDPMKCERDPKCRGNDKANDCSTQCADDPACVDRCREVQTQTGTMER